MTTVEPLAALALSSSNRTMPEVPTYLPARILNEFAYCPRLAWLEWVQKEWADSADTLEGTHVHRRVDQPSEGRPRLHQRSVELASDTLGIIAVIDLIEHDRGRARPVDYKRGHKPQVAGGAWEPERVQLCAQGLLLREHGYQCNEGVLYFAASRERVRVRFTAELVARTLRLIADARAMAASGTIPSPLEDSPKCPRCSLVSICLPDETNFFRTITPPRPIAIADPGTLPLVVQEPGSTLRSRGGELVISGPDRTETHVPVEQVSHVVLMGGVQCTSAVIRECTRREMPILHMSGGWLAGITLGMQHKNVQLRAEQFAAARDEARCLEIGRSLVEAKVANSRVLLRRNGNPDGPTMVSLARLSSLAREADDPETLLGIEGAAARLYYGNFVSMISSNDGVRGFDFEGRNRRPPRDPVNALLSFCYALLAKDWLVALVAVGLDPFMGFYHRPKYGKPALALDMMEPFRSVIADSVVIGVLNNREIGPSDFGEMEGGVIIRPAARRRVIAAWERRLAAETRHPIFGYRCSYRRIFELEARLLSRLLLGEIPHFSPFRIR